MDKNSIVGKRQTGESYFSALDMQLLLNEKQAFLDKGFVDYIEEKRENSGRWFYNHFEVYNDLDYNDILPHYLEKISFNDNNKTVLGLPEYAEIIKNALPTIAIKITMGRCTRSPKLSLVEITYLNTLSPEETLFVRGHEEGHALYWLGGLETLWRECRECGLNPRPIKFRLKYAKKHDKSIKYFLEFYELAKEVEPFIPRVEQLIGMGKKKQKKMIRAWKFAPIWDKWGRLHDIHKNLNYEEIFENSSERNADLAGVLALVKNGYKEQDIEEVVTDCNDEDRRIVLDCL